MVDKPEEPKDPNAPIKVCTFMGMEVWTDPSMPRNQFKVIMAMEPAAKFNGMLLEYYREQLTLVKIADVGTIPDRKTQILRKLESLRVTGRQWDIQYKDLLEELEQIVRGEME